MATEKSILESIYHLRDLVGYYSDPKTDDDFVRIARDVYGAGVRDNTKEQLIAIGKDYHLNGDE